MWQLLLALVSLYYLVRWLRERQVVSNLSDKYVLITGCDSGFGHLLARQLDRRGLRVLAACLTERGAHELKEQVSQRLETVILDLTNSESIAAAVQWAKEHTGTRGLWGLVNNAGTAVPSAPNEWLTKEDFMKVLDVNLLGLIEVTLGLLPLVRKARGRIVNVSSIGGRLSLFGGGYCISKFGLEAFSDSLRRELSFSGVKVAIIEPGHFKTEMANIKLMSQSARDAWDQASPEVKEFYGETFLMSHLRKVESLPSKLSADLSLATDCMEHALTARHPRTRYSAGWDILLCETQSDMTDNQSKSAQRTPGGLGLGV
ncbi:PREDICTED: retinol dehydrogenase 7-like [Condylura cristata]|uniref:retinol dehydrogenase 7-like n=1 Tax=Condylura cristata TaxID=143302 RepID=UPI0003345290|nr:PREDICTED: retinol dehydrogenase 7-like [Condylura cristata]